jgi:TatA/E family protein of Tat protein translocase
MNLAFLSIGPTEMVLILIVAVLVFGGRLPEAARKLGQQVAIFRKAARDIQREINAPMADAASAINDAANPDPTATAQKNSVWGDESADSGLSTVDGGEPDDGERTTADGQESGDGGLSTVDGGEPEDGGQKTEDS